MGNIRITAEGAESVDELGEKVGREFANEGITTSQLRRIYSEVKRAEKQYRYEDDMDGALATLRLLRPKLAYEASRDENMETVKNRVTEFMDKYAHEEAGDELRLFFELMEASIAYHAYYSETEGQ